MYDELFRYYVELGHSLCYEKAYYISARRISSVYAGILLIASAGGIVTLSIWDKVPMLWATIALLAQVLQVLQPLTQASKQRVALKYMIQDKEALFDEVSAYWNDIGSFDRSPAHESEIRSLLTEWKQRERASHDRFAGDVDFPYKNRIDRDAKKTNLRYFRYNYDTDEEREE